VAATTLSDTRASFSSTGPDVEVAAPGVGIYSTTRNGGYGTMSGTSMACPHVAGAAALLVGAGVTDVADVRYLLAMSSVDLGSGGVDPLYGYGLVDVAVALSLVDPPPPPDDDPPPPPDDDPPPPPDDDPPPPPDDPPAPALASVDWIDYAPYGGKKNNKSLSVAAAVVDEYGAPVSGATLTVRITRGRKVAYVGEAVTDSNGLAVFNITKAGKGLYVTTVIDLFGPACEWDGTTPENSFVK
jgi:subtilisin family serine protease